MRLKSTATPLPTLDPSSPRCRRRRRLCLRLCLCHHAPLALLSERGWARSYPPDSASSGLDSEDGVIGDAIRLKPVVVAGFVQARTAMLRVEKEELFL